MASILWEARGLLSLQATWEKQRSVEVDTGLSGIPPFSWFLRPFFMLKPSEPNWRGFISAIALFAFIYE